MADHFAHFFCLLHVGTPENASRAIALYNSASPDADFPLSDGFALSLQGDEGTSKLWIHDDGSGDPERVIAFVLLCAQEFDLKGLCGFQYANTCSKPRLDAFGGGAHVIDLGARKSVGWTSTDEWLCGALEGDDPDARDHPNHRLVASTHSRSTARSILSLDWPPSFATQTRLLGNIPDLPRQIATLPSCLHSCSDSGNCFLL